MRNYQVISRSLMLFRRLVEEQWESHQYGLVLKRGFGRSLIAMIIIFLWSESYSQAKPDAVDIPRHTVLARELVANIKPENNHFGLGEQTLRFPGDLFSNDYSIRADCSGLMLSLFDRAHYNTASAMIFLPSPTRRMRRLLAEDFVFSIESEKGFKRIRVVQDILPGDVLAHAMVKLTDKLENGTTGHVLLIDSVPKKIEPRSPIVLGTDQFDVTIIDSNREWTGSDDTRLADPEHKIEGVGRGSIRIYADANGELVGWARNFKNAHRFFSYDQRFPSDTRERKAAVGRPIPLN